MTDKALTLEGIKKLIAGIPTPPEFYITALLSGPSAVELGGRTFMSPGSIGLLRDFTEEPISSRQTIIDTYGFAGIQIQDADAIVRMEVSAPFEKFTAISSALMRIATEFHKGKEAEALQMIARPSPTHGDET